MFAIDHQYRGAACGFVSYDTTESDEIAIAGQRCGYGCAEGYDVNVVIDL
jgi:hypothetical protein